MDNTIETSLIFKIISKKLTPDEISDFIWLKYDKWYVRWDKRVTPKGDWLWTYYDHTAWKIFSKLSYINDTDEHTLVLLDRLEPYAEKIRNLSNVDIILSYGINFTDTTPPLCFSKDILRRISYLWASLDIELYNMRSE